MIAIGFNDAPYYITKDIKPIYFIADNIDTKYTIINFKICFKIIVSIFFKGIYKSL